MMINSNKEKHYQFTYKDRELRTLLIDNEIYLEVRDIYLILGKDTTGLSRDETYIDLEKFASLFPDKETSEITKVRGWVTNEVIPTANKRYIREIVSETIKVILGED